MREAGITLGEFYIQTYKYFDESSDLFEIHQSIGTLELKNRLTYWVESI